MRETPVVVVGAGPAGLVAAIAMARSGVECLVVERRRELSSLPRATVVSTRSMELIRAWGIEADVRAGGDEVEWLLWECRTLADAASGTGHAVGYPSGAQATMVSPTSPACVPQDHLERVLLAHLCSFPHVRVEFGTEVIAIDADVDVDAVGVTLRDAHSGEPRLVRTRYVVAADGARSAIREQLDIRMIGSEPVTDSLMVQFRAPLWDVVGTHRYGIYWVTDPQASGTMLPAGDGDRWLYGVHVDPETLEYYSDDRLVRLIRGASGCADLDVRIETRRTFSFTGQLAERWCAGRVFLVGDAAHRVTPRGGTGMNTAIAGGFDLGWKLALVLNGWAQPSLLDTYEPERRPFVEHNFDRSLDPLGSRRSVLPELQVDLAGRIPHAWLPSSDASTVDLVGPGLTLFTAGSNRWQSAARALGGSVPLTVRELDAITARSIGVFASGALLTRPDGAPVGLWHTDHHAAERLRGAVRELVGAPTVAPTTVHRDHERDVA